MKVKELQEMLFDIDGDIDIQIVLNDYEYIEIDKCYYSIGTESFNICVVTTKRGFLAD